MKNTLKIGSRVCVESSVGFCSGGTATIKKITKNYIRTGKGPFECFRRKSGTCIVKGSPYFIAIPK